jgi:hypothetical protein
VKVLFYNFRLELEDIYEESDEGGRHNIAVEEG